MLWLFSNSWVVVLSFWCAYIAISYNHKCMGQGARGAAVFDKLCQLGKFSKIICKYSGKNKTKTVQNYKTSYQESYV